MTEINLSDYLFKTLISRGVKHCFGIPGDYILPLYKTLEEMKGIEAVVGTHEPNAAFSADAYARTNGLGVLLVTYGVGALNAMNGIACAYAEMSPLLVISGAPASGSGNRNIYSARYHHEFKDIDSQLKAFESVTGLCLQIEDTSTAAETIDTAIDSAVKMKLPVYLEIPTNLFNALIPAGASKKEGISSAADEQEKAVDYFISRIEKSERPVLQTGVEISRFKLQHDILNIVENNKLPFVSTPLGKGTFPETTNHFLGIYAGILTPTVELRNFIEASDLVVMLGTKITDVNCGAYTADLKKDSTLIANTEFTGDDSVQFNDISFDLFVKRLSEKLSEKKFDKSSSISDTLFDYGKSASAVDKYLHEINEFLTDEHVLIADTGDSCYGSLFMTTKRANGYFAPLFYNTMGFAVPAALGVQLGGIHAQGGGSPG